MPLTLAREPALLLRSVVERVWATDGRGAPSAPSLERVVPTGAMHVVLRLSPAPLVLFGDERGGSPHTVGHAVVGGARSRFYVRAVAEPTHAVGAQLRPGAASLLLGVPAIELAEAHTALDDLWGARVSLAREELAEADSLADALDLFEAFLATELARRSPSLATHPAVAHAISLFERGASIGEAVRRSGYSHRTFLTLFRASVGVAPKVFARVRRAQRALDRLASPRAILADVAAEAGYADQAHFTRELREIAGVSPSEHRALAPRSPNHVPIVIAPHGRRRGRARLARG